MFLKLNDPNSTLMTAINPTTGCSGNSRSRRM